MRFSSIIATGTLAVMTATMAFAEAHSTPEGVAASARQAHMQLYAFNLGVLGNMAKGSVDFDAEASQAAADNLASLSSMHQMAYWMPGTSSTDMEDSRALPAIWESGSDVGEKAKGLTEAAAAMQAGAGTLDGVRANIGAVGGACGACHKAYRAPDS